MTWKAYAAVSGAGVLATYMGLGRPALAPEHVPAASPAAAAASRPAADIQTEALRLETRLAPSDVRYVEPARDPFRFETRRLRSAAHRSEPQVAAPPAQPVRPEPPLLRLAGIVSSGGDENQQRIAILMTPNGRLEVREGDAVGADYRVTRIDEDAIEVTAPDGSARRLRLRP